MCVFLLALIADNELAWPREIKVPEGTITVYQPQIESLEGDRLTGRAAVSVKLPSAPEPVFGAFWFSARVATDRAARTCECLSIDVTNARFPKAKPENIETFSRIVEREASAWKLKGSLDALTANLAAIQKERATSENLSYAPPKIFVRERPAALIVIDGKPFFRAVEGSSLQKLMNTPGFVVKTSTAFYLKGGALWFSAAELQGPWTKIHAPPAEVVAAYSKENPKADESALKPPPVPPEILVSTEPAELIVSEGAPSYAPITNTRLLALKNSANDVFIDIDTQKTFVLFSGRWFRGPSLQGPWEGVAADKLPPEFAKLPPGQEYDDILCHVAGTPQAKDAIMDAQVPQTAVVSRKDAKLTVTYDGPPQFKKIEGTSMELATNTPMTVLKIGSRYHCCNDGVWFDAPSAQGPWAVSTKAPPEVQSLPPEAPCYHVKYCYVYDSTPEVVYVGYTPGYMGCYVSAGAVVFGTGYAYPVYGPVYYPRPCTFGFGFHYSSLTGGWGVSFGVGGAYGGFGLAVGPNGWAVGVGGGYGGRVGFSYSHVDVDRDVTVNANKNVYNQQRSDVNVQNREQRQTERDQSRGERQTERDQSRGERQTERDQSRGERQTQRENREPRATGERPNDVLSDREGNAYRQGKDGSWETHGRDGWTKPEAKPETKQKFEQSRSDLQRQAQSRQSGEARTQRAQSAVNRGVPRGGGGGRGGRR